mmetsp:Transcript_55198/g.129229  ORF Transcript_55198/g.129229 Transcript_55198/m.129229 type:complete len:278 (+) Transcript_55198:658-1491(+)
MELKDLAMGWALMLGVGLVKGNSKTGSALGLVMGSSKTGSVPGRSSTGSVLGGSMGLALGCSNTLGSEMGYRMGLVLDGVFFFLRMLGSRRMNMGMQSNHSSSCILQGCNSHPAASLLNWTHSLVARCLSHSQAQPHPHPDQSGCQLWGTCGTCSPQRLTAALASTPAAPPHRGNAACPQFLSHLRSLCPLRGHLQTPRGSHRSHIWRVPQGRHRYRTQHLAHHCIHSCMPRQSTAVGDHQQWTSSQLHKAQDKEPACPERDPDNCRMLRQIRSKRM